VSNKAAQFDFEKLIVYQKALKFVNAIFTLSGQLPGRVQYFKLSTAL